MADIGTRIEESKNWFEKAAHHLPGYRGYKDKELRREADKIERLYLAEQLEACRHKLDEVMVDLTHRTDLGPLDDLDVSLRKLRRLRDRIQFADYGYAGLFDAVKVDEPILDQLYQYDAQAQEQVRGLVDFCNALSADSPSLSADIGLLDERVDALDAFFSEREHLITGAGR